MRGNVGNLGAYEEELLSPGKYEVEITKAEETESQNGNSGLALSMTILDGPDTDAGESPQGKKLTTTLWYPHNGMKDKGKYSGLQLRKACDAVGSVYDDQGFDIEAFVNATVFVKVGLEDYEGETRPRVKTFLPA